MNRGQAPVLIQRELLLSDSGAPAARAIEVLVSFLRRGRPALLVAEQPVRWRPTRRAVDHDLALQQQLHQAVRRAGAEIDGIVYLTTGLFARRQARLTELDELANRYDLTGADLTLIAREPVLLESIVRTGGRALAIGETSVGGAVGYSSLKEALRSLG